MYPHVLNVLLKLLAKVLQMIRSFLLIRLLTGVIIVCSADDFSERAEILVKMILTFIRRLVNNAPSASIYNVSSVFVLSTSYTFISRKYCRPLFAFLLPCFQGRSRQLFIFSIVTLFRLSFRWRRVPLSSPPPHRVIPNLHFPVIYLAVQFHAINICSLQYLLMLP